MAKDFYDILGVSRDAKQDEIKKAYKKLAKKHHPDLNKGAKASEEKFKEVNKAFETLNNPEKRQAYDRFGEQGANGFNNSGFGGGGSFNAEDFGFGNINDIFEGLFSGGFGGSRQNRNAPRKGEDLKIEIKVTFREAAHGVKKNITVQRKEACSNCGSAGGFGKKTCRSCNGTGEIKRVHRTILGNMVNVTTCSDCGGSGNSFEKICSDCRGEGRKTTSKNITVDIPAGVDTGNMLKLRGEGNAGFKGGPSGDIYVVVTVEKDKVFERDGNDIYMASTITFSQAALGTTIDVPTLAGKTAELKIPQGTQTHTLFRLKKRGFPNLNGFGSGDQFVRVIINTPKSLSKKEKELLEELGEIENKESPKTEKSFFDKFRDNVKEAF